MRFTFVLLAVLAGCEETAAPAATVRTGVDVYLCDGRVAEFYVPPDAVWSASQCIVGTCSPLTSWEMRDDTVTAICPSESHVVEVRWLMPG